MVLVLLEHGSLPALYQNPEKGPVTVLRVMTAFSVYQGSRTALIFNADGHRSNLSRLVAKIA